MNIITKLRPYRLKSFIAQMRDKITDEWYIYVTIPHLVNRIRRKERKIRFLFLLTELASWKTEMLYLAMLKHPRFEPVIGVTSNRENLGAEQILIKYLSEKGYSYIWIDENKDLISQTHADIITFQKPYPGHRHPKHLAWNNRRAIYCCFGYGFRITLGAWTWLMNQRYYYIGFRTFFENQSVLNDYRPLFNVRGNRLVATGIPMMDQLIRPASEYPNPWKNNDSRKRIIYAPHHTIGDMHLNGIALSTFLEYGEFMLRLADKYHDKVVFAFKPHPVLYTKLLRCWGQEKTDRYYSEWKSRENCQLENGAYDGLFKHSDGMIHDCSSFVNEYQYSQRPALYLLRKENDCSNLTSLGRNSFDLHYKATNELQIEEFIQNVINGIDPLKDAREQFYKTQLLPPHGKSACENIINVILGEEEYKEQ